MRRAAVFGVVLAGLTLSACTFVPTDAHPQVVNSRTVPFDLLVRTPTTTTTTTRPPTNL